MIRSLSIHPIHALQHGELRGAEARVRVIRPHGMSGVGAEPAAPAAPGDFDFLLQEAANAAAGWNRLAGALGPLRVTVNLPPYAAAEADGLAAVTAALHAASLKACLLEIGFPAEEAFEATREAAQLAVGLRDLGCRLTLDRCEGAPEQLQVLRKLPFTAIRLAPSLVGELAESATARALAAGMVRQAHDQNALVVAQAVATSLQRDILADLGCDEAQGPLMGGVVAPATFSLSLQLVGDWA